MRDLLFKDFWWKLFSLVLAAFIWFTVDKLIEEPQPTDFSNVPVTYGEMPVLIVATAADMHLYHVSPDKVSVTVTGPPGVMSVLQANEIRVTVDLSNLDPAKGFSQPVDVEVSVPGGVTLVKVTPTKVSVIVPPKS